MALNHLQAAERSLSFARALPAGLLPRSCPQSSPGQCLPCVCVCVCVRTARPCNPCGCVCACVCVGRARVSRTPEGTVPRQPSCAMLACLSSLSKPHPLLLTSPLPPGLAHGQAAGLDLQPISQFVLLRHTARCEEQISS
jgi:hypothetical protein